MALWNIFESGFWSVFIRIFFVKISFFIPFPFQVYCNSFIFLKLKYRINFWIDIHVIHEFNIVLEIRFVLKKYLNILKMNIFYSYEYIEQRFVFNYNFNGKYDKVTFFDVALSDLTGLIAVILVKLYCWTRDSEKIALIHPTRLKVLKAISFYSFFLFYIL